MQTRCKLEEHSIEVHRPNSLDRLTLALILTFDLIFIGGRGIVIDYHSVCQVWRFLFQPFWFYRADRQTDRQRRMIAILTRLPSARVNNHLNHQYYDFK